MIDETSLTSYEFDRNGIPLIDTILYNKNPFYWPEVGRLGSKHVVVM